MVCVLFLSSWDICFCEKKGLHPILRETHYDSKIRNISTLMMLGRLLVHAAGKLLISCCCWALTKTSRTLANSLVRNQYPHTCALGFVGATLLLAVESYYLDEVLGIS